LLHQILLNCHSDYNENTTLLKTFRGIGVAVKRFYCTQGKKRVIPSTKCVVFNEPCGLAEALCVTEPDSGRKSVSGFNLPCRSSEMKRHLYRRKPLIPQPVNFPVVKREKGSPLLLHPF